MNFLCFFTVVLLCGRGFFFLFTSVSIRKLFGWREAIYNLLSNSVVAIRFFFPTTAIVAFFSPRYRVYVKFIPFLQLTNGKM